MADPSVLDQLVVELDAIEAELSRRRWAHDPVVWAKDKLGIDLWSKQADILRAVRDHRKTCAATCHEIGKALALDTPLPTPTGWTTMGDVHVGDLLLDEDGKPTRVTAISPVEHREASRVVFRDGSCIVASDDHRWSALDLKSRPRKVQDWRQHWDRTTTLTTREMAAAATVNGQARWRIPTTMPLATAMPWPLTMAPYTFGAWLGNGTTVRAELTVHRQDAEHFMQACGGTTVVHHATKQSSRIALSTHPYVDVPVETKRIPPAALRASVQDRLAMLRGIMDTDGHCRPKHGRMVELTLCDADLIEDVYELVVSLGWVAWRDTRPAKIKGRIVGTAYRIHFTPNVNPFVSLRKAQIWEQCRIEGQGRNVSSTTQRTIAAFEPMGVLPVKCVTVDSARHLYLAGRAMVPTHNSFGAGLLAAWWIDTHKPGEAFVVTTAPTAPQIKTILWKEIGRAHSLGSLPGRINTTGCEWKLLVGGKEEIVGMGRKPNDYSPAAFQGIHSPYVLVIIDEANGVRGALHDALDSLIANDQSKLVMIGNPDDPTGEFYEACKPGSGYFVIHVSAFDSPNFTGEAFPAAIKKQLIGHLYVEERRAKWAPHWTWNEARTACIMPAGSTLEETHPFWQSKVLGQFPVQTSAGSLIPLAWIRAAQERTLPAIGPNELGLDVGASLQGDPSCCGHRIGPVFRVLYEERQPDTMKTTGRLIQTLHSAQYGASLAKVDYIGVGRGVVDRCREQGLPVYPVSVGEASTVYSCRICKHEFNLDLFPRKRQQEKLVLCPNCNSNQVWAVFANMLSQIWWSIRTMFEAGEIDIDAHDEDLASELISIHWEPNSKGQTVVKYSEELPSPNRADALLMSYAPAHEPPTEEILSW